MAEAPRDRLDAVVLLVVWVLPLLAVAGLLAAAGLPQVAVALLVVELVVAGLVALARRRPDGSRKAPAWVVPVAMVAVVGGVLALAVVGERLG